MFSMKQTPPPSAENCRQKTSTLSAKRILFDILKGVLALLVWLVIWELCALKIGKELILPAPTQVLKTIGSLLISGETWRHAGLSLLRIAAGYLFGVISGAVLALLTCTVPVLDWLISPVIRTVRATPVASFIILALLWIGKSRVPTLMSTLIVAPIIWQNITVQFKAVDKDLTEMGRMYGFTKRKMLRLIYMPQVMPAFIAGCIGSVGMAWKSGIAAEVLCLPEFAIGSQVYYSKIYLETPSLFAWTAIVIVLSYILEKTMQFLLKKTIEGRKAK